MGLGGPTYVPAMPTPARHVIGCMTGTSIDGLDVALIRVEGHGFDLRPTFVGFLSRSLGDLAAPLRQLAEQHPMTAGDITRLARDLALAHAEAAAALLRQHRLAGADLIAVHGQTVFHAPPLSWQLFNPAPVAAATGCPVVFDLRAADLAAGGQGAPITPLADFLFFGHEHEARAVVNLGGFCNITMLPAGPRARQTTLGIRGFDLCACNHLLDGIARKLLYQPFDADGATALSGNAHAEALEDLSGVLASQRRSAAGRARSLGTGDELAEWISRFRARVSPADLAATACEGVGQFIARALTDGTDAPARILLAGGGVKNAALVRSITDWSSARVEPTDAHGVPAQAREAAEIGVLGVLAVDGEPITLSAVTGVANPPRAGVVCRPPAGGAGP
jgi:1,6-anhydro-N-acetylmuramate kinase